MFDLEKYLALSIVDGSTEDQDTRVASSTYSLKFQTPFFSAQDTIISEVTWVDHNQLIIKATNRIGNVLKVGYFVIGDEEEEDGENVVWGMTVREVDWSVADGGWEEPVSHFPLSPLNAKRTYLVLLVAGTKRSRNLLDPPSTLEITLFLNPRLPSRLPRYHYKLQRV